MHNQLTLSFENPKLMDIFKELASNMKGVTILAPVKSNKSGIDFALEDIEKGRISGPFNSVDDLMRHLDSL